MRLQILSDLHLEFGLFDVPKTDADIIIAAGDIHVQTEALAWLKVFEKPVIYVAGNHEYWCGDLKRVGRTLREACAGTAIHYLENACIEISHVRFLGCTLWTSMDFQHPAIMQRIGMSMNDFNYILCEGDSLLPDDIVGIHLDSLAWLKRELGKPYDGTTVVVTHHAPTMASWAGRPDDVIRFAYCNDLVDLINTADIDIWVHGHIHHALDYKVGKTRVICNPRGYYGYQLVDAFEPGKIVEI